MRTPLCLLGLTLAVSGLTVGRDASAIERFDLSNATADCQSSLPVFDGNVRKRPTAVSNEGTKSAFVTCSVHNYFNAESSNVFAATFTNNTAADVDVNCTMVNGLRYIGAFTPSFFPKTVHVLAGETAEPQWTADDNQGNPFADRSFNLSCNLPVGVEIGSVYTIYEDGSVAAP
ncbi:MAG: hypothetical protein ABJA62_10000 [Luteimonas sp.]